MKKTLTVLLASLLMIGFASCLSAGRDGSVPPEHPPGSVSGLYF